MISWRSVEGFPDYEVSSTGLVRRATPGTHIAAGAALAQSLVDGYWVVTLFADGKKKQVKVHRIVAAAFVPRVEGKPLAAHNDGVSTNNVASNLRWATCLENLADRVAHGTEMRGARNGRTKLDEAAVSFIRENYQPRHPQHGAAALARVYGVSDVAIIKAFKGVNWAQV
jgi:hypothetical protein